MCLFPARVILFQIRIISRDSWAISETSIGILDFFKNTINAPILIILIGCVWLTNLTLLFGFDKVCQSSIQSDNSIESYRVYDLS